MLSLSKIRHTFLRIIRIGKPCYFDTLRLYELNRVFTFHVFVKDKGFCLIQLLFCEPSKSSVSDFGTMSFLRFGQLSLHLLLKLILNNSQRAISVPVGVINELLYQVRV